MQTLVQIGLEDVQAVYSGPEGRLWELLMGEQIHIGGLASSRELAARAGIGASGRGVDLCCCTGAGMRFLLRQGAEQMTGVDATAAMLELASARNRASGCEGRCWLVLADACASGLPDGSFDFVWGEDAWCYVTDKPALAAEAARLARPGGRVAFSDWVAGPAGLAGDDLAWLLRFMKFPNLESIEGWRGLLEAQGLTVSWASYTGRFAAHARLYLDMLQMQLSGDALAILGHDEASLAGVLAGLERMLQLAESGKIEQAMFVAHKQ